MNRVVPASQTAFGHVVADVRNDHRGVMALAELRDRDGQPLPLAEFFDPVHAERTLYQPIAVAISNDDLRRQCSTAFYDRFPRGAPAFSLSYVLQTFAALERPGGIFLNARSGAGKSVAGLAAFMDCFREPATHDTPHDSSLAGYLPVVLEVGVRLSFLGTVSNATAALQQATLAHFEEWLWWTMFKPAPSLTQPRDQPRLPFDRPRFDQWLKYSPPLLLLVDLNTANDLERHAFAGALREFQRAHPRHRCVVTYRSAIHDAIVREFVQSADFTACDLQPLPNPQARCYYENFQRLRAARAGQPVNEAALTEELAAFDTVFARLSRERSTLLTVPLMMHFASLIGAQRVQALREPSELYEAIVRHFIIRDYQLPTDGMQKVETTAPLPQLSPVFGHCGVDEIAAVLHVLMTRLALAILAQGPGQTRLQAVAGFMAITRLERLWDDGTDPCVEGSTTRWHPPAADMTAVWGRGPYYNDTPAITAADLRVLRRLGLLHVDGAGVGFVHDSFIYFYAARSFRAWRDVVPTANRNRRPELDATQGYAQVTHPWYRATVNRLRAEPEVWLETAEFLGGMLPPQDVFVLALEILVAEPHTWADWPRLLQRLLRGRRPDPNGDTWHRHLHTLAFLFHYETDRIHRFPEGLLSYFYELLSDLRLVQPHGTTLVQAWLEPAIACRQPYWLKKITPDPTPWPHTLAFAGAKGPITCVAWYNEHAIVAGSDDGNVYYWEPEAGYWRILITHSDGVKCLAVAEVNGETWVVSGGGDGTVRYDTPGLTLAPDDAARIRIRHTYLVRAVAVNASGCIVSGSWDYTVRYDTPGLALAPDDAARIRIRHTNDVRAVAVNASGCIVSGSVDHTVRYDTPGLALAPDDAARIRIRHTNDVRAVAVNASGCIVSGSVDHTVRYDTPGLTLAPDDAARIRIRHTYWVGAVAVNASGCIVSGGGDGTVRYDTPGLTLAPDDAARIRIRHTRLVSAVAVNASGCIVSGSDDNTVRYDTPGLTLAPDDAARIRIRHTNRVSAVAVNASGCIVSGSDDNTVRYDTPGLALAPDDAARIRIRHTNDVRAVAVNASGCIVSGSWDGTVRYDMPGFALAPNAEERIRIRHTNDVSTVAVNASGCIVSGSWDYTVRYDTPGLTLAPDDAARIRIRHTYLVRAVAVNASGCIVSGSDDYTVRYDTPGLALAPDDAARIRIRHTNDVRAVAVNASGCIVSGSDDKTVRYDAPELALAPDAEERIRIRHTNWVSAVAVNASGCIVSGSWDGTVRYDMPGFALDPDDLARIRIPHTNRVTSVAVNDAGCIVSGSEDCSIGFYMDAIGVRRFLWFEHVDAMAISEDGVITFTSKANPKAWQGRLYRGLEPVDMRG